MTAVKSTEPKSVPFEEALKMAGFGRFNLVMMLLITGIVTAIVFETMSVAYLVPASACELQTTNGNQGLMAGMPLIGILAASNFWGYQADTKGRRKILIASLILGFFAGMLATFSPNWIVFCFLKFLSASAMAGTFGLSVTFVSECTPEHRRFTFLILMTSMFLTAAGIMAALTIPILSLKFSYYIPYLDIHFNSWRLLNIVYSVPSAFAAVGAFFAVESPKFLISSGEDEKGLEVLRRMFVINSGKSGDSYEVRHVILDEENASQTSKGIWASIVSQTVPLLKPPLLQKTLLLSVLYVAVYFCLNPFTVWLPYMVDGFMKSLEKGDVGFTFCQMLRSSQNVTTNDEPDDCTLNQSAMTLVFGMNLFLASLNVVMAGLLRFFGRKTLLITLQLVSGASALLINVCTEWMVTAVLIITFIAGILNFGFLSTFSVDVFPTYVKAMGVCLTLMVGRGSAVLGINILKNLLVSNCEASFYIFGGITVFGGFVGFLLPSENPKGADKKRCVT